VSVGDFWWGETCPDKCEVRSAKFVVRSSLAHLILRLSVSETFRGIRSSPEFTPETPNSLANHQQGLVLSLYLARYYYSFGRAHLVLA
jgi:hypothetical protein